MKGNIIILTSWKYEAENSWGFRIKCHRYNVGCSEGFGLSESELSVALFIWTDLDLCLFWAMRLKFDYLWLFPLNQKTIWFQSLILLQWLQFLAFWFLVKWQQQSLCCCSYPMIFMYVFTSANQNILLINICMLFMLFMFTCPSPCLSWNLPPAQIFLSRDEWHTLNLIPKALINSVP